MHAHSYRLLISLDFEPAFEYLVQAKKIIYVYNIAVGSHFHSNLNEK